VPSRPSYVNESDVVVTTLVMTFNHEQFIREAVDSALAQELDVPHEILIADDSSTDATSAIVHDYRAAHPDRIRLLELERNLGENVVRARGTRAARGKYVALLDGDDYWISPHKLARQIELLEARPEWAICFHNALVVYDDPGIDPHPFHTAHPAGRLSRAVPPPSCTVEQLVAGNFMQTSSVMFRNHLIPAFPDWYYEARIPDWPFHVLNAEHGLIGYIDEPLSAYRVHAGGAWSDRISHLRDPQDLIDLVSIHDAINRHLEYRYDARTRRRTATLAGRAAKLLARQGRFEEAAVYARRSLADAAESPGLVERMRLEVLSRPRLARAAARVVVAEQTVG
jgi:glycosyltransferase involved in cell wall biosynthesis